MPSNLQHEVVQFGLGLSQRLDGFLVAGEHDDLSALGQFRENAGGSSTARRVEIHEDVVGKHRYRSPDVVGMQKHRHAQREVEICVHAPPVTVENSSLALRYTSG